MRGFRLGGRRVASSRGLLESQPRVLVSCVAHFCPVQCARAILPSIVPIARANVKRRVSEGSPQLERQSDLIVTHVLCRALRSRRVLCAEGFPLSWVHARDRAAPAVRSCQQRRESVRMAYNETTTRTEEMWVAEDGRAGKWVTSCARMRTVVRISGCASG